MQSIPSLKREKDPFVQLVILFGLILGGLVLLTLMSVGIGLLLHGKEILVHPEKLASLDPSNVNFVKLQLVMQQLLIFLTPALLLAVIEKRKVKEFYGLANPKVELLLTIFLIMVCATPILGLVTELNLKMHLPNFLKSVEHWMRRLEDEGAATTQALLKAHGVSGLVINLLVVAVIPAVCEEILFRGALQRIFLRLLKNPHVAIWLSAAVFSTIHFQFFGFFPRLFLGAAFGYIYFWTGSLKYTMFAHFLQNAYGVAVMFYLSKNNIPVEKADEMNIAWYGYAISAILTLALFYSLKRKTETQEID